VHHVVEQVAARTLRIEPPRVAGRVEARLETRLGATDDIAMAVLYLASPASSFVTGKIWEVDSHAAIKGLAEVASDFNHTSIVDLNLGANLYALPTDFSPYVGGAMGLTYGSVPGDRAFGLNIGASLGALLFRTSNAQMNLEGNAQMMLTELNHEKPSIYSARLGVLF